LPWEYCFDEDFGFLSLDPGLPMVRFIQQPYTAENILAPRPTRVLLASATPSGFSDVSADEETELISTELKALVEEGVIELHYLKHLTSEKLQEELIDFNPHIFHFIGHGTFALDSEKGALILEWEDGSPRELSSRQLGQLLRGKEVKIIILNACKTAAHGGNNAFMGLAPALVKARVPAVIAMQYAMPDRTAPLFARQIYKYLTKGLPLDRAITEARINLFTSGDENIFWAIPVLFMRAKDGVIWQEHRN
jgi:CHAT domain-containing protein